MQRATCKNGHELTPENTYVNPNSGFRRCKICKNGYDREWRRNLPKHIFDGKPVYETARLAALMQVAVRCNQQPGWFAKICYDCGFDVGASGDLVDAEMNRYVIESGHVIKLPNQEYVACFDRVIE